jgi:hypothetical protein
MRAQPDLEASLRTRSAAVVEALPPAEWLAAPMEARKILTARGMTLRDEGTTILSGSVADDSDDGAR